MKGSITVEASLVLPIFVFALLSILYINQMFLQEERVQCALVRAGEESSSEYGMVNNKAVANAVYWGVKVNTYAEGSVLISTVRSSFDEETKEMNLVADYAMKIPFPLFQWKICTFTQGFRTRAFVGVKTRQQENVDLSKIVYITKTGKVFHETQDCTYLTLKISAIQFRDVESMRSQGGAKYYPCEGCCKNKSMLEDTTIFICNYGNRYHCVRNCSKIKRSIERVTLAEVGNRVACSKCGGRE